MAKVGVFGQRVIRRGPEMGQKGGPEPLFWGVRDLDPGTPCLARARGDRPAILTTFTTVIEDVLLGIVKIISERLLTKTGFLPKMTTFWGKKGHF